VSNPVRALDYHVVSLLNTLLITELGTVVSIIHRSLLFSFMIQTTGLRSTYRKYLARGTLGTANVGIIVGRPSKQRPGPWQPLSRLIAPVAAA
jgi:hypothetical protein